MKNMASYRDYVLSGDFQGSKERMEKANKRWKGYWFECCIEISEKFIVYKEKYIFDKENLTITLKKVKPRNAETRISNPHSYDLDTENNYFYLIKFYDERDNFLRSKIGTTTRPLVARLREHFYKNTPYSKMNAEYLIIDKIYTCIKNPEGLESYIKGLLMLEYTKIGNDQFLEDIDWEDYDRIIQEYLQKELDK